MTADEALAALMPQPGLVVLMCGLAGSGKTTFSQRLEAKGFARLSFDELVWSRAGRFGVDYDPADYQRHLEAARPVLQERLVALMSSSRCASRAMPAAGSAPRTSATRKISAASRA